MSYPEHLLGEPYHTAETQSVYSTAPADWAEKHFLWLVNLYLLLWELSMLISYELDMILFQIETLYCYGLKIERPEVYWSKERHLGESNYAIYQKVAEILQAMPLRLFVNLCKIWPVWSMSVTKKEMVRHGATIANCQSSIALYRW